MKNLTLTLIGALLLGASCTKEVKETEPEMTDLSQSTKNSIQIYLDENGNTIEYDQLNFDLPDYAIAVEAYDEESDTYTNRYFESEERMYAYSKEHSDYAFMTRKIEQIREVRALAIETGDIELENERDELSPEMTELLSQIAMENNSSNNRGVAILHAPIPNNSVFPLMGQPQFSFFNFRNKASIISGASVFNQLWSRTWFRGHSVVVMPILGPLYLSNYNMHLNAESGQ